jgi:hypothetical protein
MASQAKNTFEIPKWSVVIRSPFNVFTSDRFRAGKPVAGLHLDVVKDGRLVQVSLKFESFYFERIVFHFTEIDDR